MGSSPRTWGRRLPELRAVLDWRFIPTHVGQTDPRRDCRGEDAVHPHARGADPGGLSEIVRRYGSSPRTWGRLAAGGPAGLRGRFIPTHVGQTQVVQFRGGQTPVHPHARGADEFELRFRVLPAGSSPRTWGRLHAGSLCRSHSRFIPTHVGQTSCLCRLPPAASVHPHARGADVNPVRRFGPGGGSSPRTWGRRDRAAKSPSACRFIPTHVGQTPIGMPYNPEIAVHPHARGADPFPAPAASRGIRFIPTHVGQT